MTTAMRHDVWVRANGKRPAPKHPAKRPPKPLPPPRLTVECRVCHWQTIAKSPEAPTLVGWTVDEWPAEPQEFGNLGGVCSRCNKAQAGAE